MGTLETTGAAHSSWQRASSLLKGDVSRPVMVGSELSVKSSAQESSSAMDVPSCNQQMGLSTCTCLSKMVTEKQNKLRFNIGSDAASLSWWWSTAKQHFLEQIGLRNTPENHLVYGWGLCYEAWGTTLSSWLQHSAHNPLMKIRERILLCYSWTHTTTTRQLFQ